MSAINPITADPNFSQGIKGNKYWAIRQYDKCSGNTNNPNSGWDHKFIIDYDKAFEFRGDLYRGSSSYGEQSWTAIMQGKTPWGTASTDTSCEITRKATDSTFSILTGPYFPKLASNYWYVQATMAWFTDLKPSTSTVKARAW